MKVWYSSEKGFRVGVLGFPDDSGTLLREDDIWRFRGRHVSFALDQPAHVRMVMEPPGWAASSGVGIVVLGLALVGVSPPLLLIAILITLVLFAGHAAISRWVLIEQPDDDGTSRKAYLTPAGTARYGAAPRHLYEQIRKDVRSPVQGM